VVEQELQENEEEVTDTLERGRSELSSREADLDTYETTVEVDWKSLGDLRVEVLVHELATNLKANHLAFREKELADREKQLAVMHPRELTATQKRLEELLVAWAIKAQKVWDFLGPTKTALVPLCLNPLRSMEPVQEVSAALPQLDSTGVKMLKLEEVIGDQLVAEGCVLVEKVVMCFRSRDPIASLDPVVLELVVEIEEVASSGVQDAAKVVAAWFQHLPEDA
jgi:hypothetical protein